MGSTSTSARHASAYRDRVLSADEAAALVGDDSTVYTNGGTGLPNRFLSALARRADGLRDVVLGHPMRREAFPLDPDPVAPEFVGRLFHESDFTFDPPVLEAVRDARASYRPIQPNLCAKHYPHEVDLLVAAASPMDDHGWFSLGAFGGWIFDFVARARRVVLEVNARQPRVFGNNFVHVHRVDGVIEADYPLVGIQQSGTRPSAEEQAIARYVCEVIDDGATLQVGAGTVPDAVARLLIDSGRRDLGVHSEAVFDWAVDLVEAGVVTNARKTSAPGRITTSMIFGSQRLYRFIADNPQVEVHPVSYVNDPCVIARNHRQVAINSTILIDLFGQCASETIGPQHYSGTGGQWNFHYGASLSAGGAGVIALPSTGKGGTLSRIVPTLPPGTVVSIPRNDLHCVATEYGIVDVRGQSMDERARRLISVAHPRFREGLERAARDDLKLIRRRIY